MRLLQTTALAICIAGAATTAASAQTTYNYTFNVPVSVTNAPAGSNVAAACFLMNGPNGSGSQDGQGALSAQQTLPSGSYSGTLTVKLSGPTKPRSYGCALQVVFHQQLLNITPNGDYTSRLQPGWTGTPTTVVNLP